MQNQKIKKILETSILKNHLTNKNPFLIQDKINAKPAQKDSKKILAYSIKNSSILKKFLENKSGSSATLKTIADKKNINTELSKKGIFTSLIRIENLFFKLPTDKFEKRFFIWNIIYAKNQKKLFLI